MDRCAACGHAYFSAWRTGHRNGVCSVCRLKKVGGLGRKKVRADRGSTFTLYDGDWLALHEAAAELGLKVATVTKPRWLTRLGAVKVGRRWLVTRAALRGLIEQERGTGGIAGPDC